MDQLASFAPTASPSSPPRSTEQLIVLNKRADTTHGELYDAQIAGSPTVGLLKVVRTERLRSPVEVEKLRHDVRKQRKLRLVWENLHRSPESISEAHEGLGYAHLMLPIEVGETADAVWLLRPFVEATPLDAFLQLHGPRPAAEVAAWGMQLAAALDVLHRVGLVHREIKPAHVLLTQHGTAMLIDAGIGLRSTLHEPASCPWLAPEVAQGQAPSFRADLYSLGWILLHALVGKHVDPPQTLLTEAAGSSAELHKLLQATLSPDPAKRPLSAYQIYHWLNPFGRTSRISSEPLRSSLRPPSASVPPSVFPAATSLRLAAPLPPAMPMPRNTPAGHVDKTVADALATATTIRPAADAKAAAGTSRAVGAAERMASEGRRPTKQKAGMPPASTSLAALPRRVAAEAESRTSRSSWRLSIRDPAFRATVVLAALTAALVCLGLAALAAAVLWMLQRG